MEYCLDGAAQSCDGYMVSGGPLVCGTDGSAITTLLLIILLCIFIPIAFCCLLGCAGFLLCGSVLGAFSMSNYRRRPAPFYAQNQQTPVIVGGYPQDTAMNPISPAAVVTPQASAPQPPAVFGKVVA